ncbi:hypothetical protein KP509_04G005700 [Ceratopteris richardii]|uniref:Uncharacterized protein n=1 Tax=Ceratopteris richardii TaxID=49495 RepID=A0A8T2V1U8_CERRI|nr:hypothetical protein KP509_04G005700 [Ceratopteris richardii]
MHRYHLSPAARGHSLHIYATAAINPFLSLSLSLSSTVLFERPSECCHYRWLCFLRVSHYNDSTVDTTATSTTLQHSNQSNGLSPSPLHASSNLPFFTCCVSKGLSSLHPQLHLPNLCDDLHSQSLGCVQKQKIYPLSLSHNSLYSARALLAPPLFGSLCLSHSRPISLYRDTPSTFLCADESLRISPLRVLTAASQSSRQIFSLCSLST